MPYFCRLLIIKSTIIPIYKDIKIYQMELFHGELVNSLMIIMTKLINILATMQMLEVEKHASEKDAKTETEKYIGLILMQMCSSILIITKKEDITTNIEI